MERFRILLDCKTVGFFLKISTKIGVFSLVPDLLFDCSPVLEYAKIWTVLQSRILPETMTIYVCINFFIKGDHLIIVP